MKPFVKNFIKESISLILLASLLFGLTACSSSSDPVTDVTKQFAAINRTERQNAGGMNFTEQQATKLLDIIAPVVTGIPLTPDLAEEMLADMDKLLTDEQRELIEESIANAPGIPGQGGGPDQRPRGSAKANRNQRSIAETSAGCVP